jgi:hypothetical protein
MWVSLEHINNRKPEVISLVYHGDLKHVYPDNVIEGIKGLNYIFDYV